MKKLVFLLSMTLVTLTSCNIWNEPENADPAEPKYVSKITHTNGSVISIEYDSDMRVKGISYVDAEDAAKSCDYDVKYNLNMTNNNVTFDIITADGKYVMKFNEYGALSEYVQNNASQKVLSTFEYDSYSSIGAFHLELDKVVDKVNGGEVKRIDWSYGAPIYQINQVVKRIEGTDYTYSTTVNYDFERYYSNVMANVNLFTLLTPEFLEYSNIPNELAVVVSVFGTRSSYLPTDVTVTKGRSMAGENYVELSKDERKYIYEYEEDNSGCISKIYTGTSDKDKKILYTITYVGEEK